MFACPLRATSARLAQLLDVIVDFPYRFWDHAGTMDSETLFDLTVIAHRLWCARMVAAGWRHGPQFDPQARTHDAITDFSGLSTHDRRHAVAGVEAQGLEAVLAAAIAYQRGPDREFRLNEMRTGATVRSAARGTELIGRIESWKSEGDALTLIRVLWSDGSRSEHDPVLRELARADEALPQ